MGNCFSDDTEILTNQGWKLFENLDQSENVMTLNTDKNELEWQKPSAYIKKEYPEMLLFGNSRDPLSIMVSPDHNMVIKLHQDQKTKIIPISDLPNRSYVQMSGFKWNKGLEFKDIKIPSIKKYKNQFDVIGKDTEDIFVGLPIFLRLLGIFLSDGSINMKSKQIRITQSFNNKKKREEIEKMLEKLPFKFKKKKEEWYVCKKQVFNFFLEFGMKNKKEVPLFVFSLSTNLIKNFLDFFFLGDGWFHKGTKYYIFGEKKLADQIQQLELMCGNTSVLREVDPQGRIAILKNGQKIKATKKDWVMTVGKKRFSSVFKKRIKRIDYAGRFAFCVTVKNHTVFVRRNGRVFLSGNSGSTYSTKGGDGTHLDYRIVDKYNQYVNPYEFLSNY
jgi:replicative DNA helicase Mcm